MQLSDHQSERFVVFRDTVMSNWMLVVTSEKTDTLLTERWGWGTGFTSGVSQHEEMNIITQQN